MITYSFDKKNIKQRVKELTLLQTKWFIVVAAIMLPFMIFYFCVGEREAAVEYGAPLAMGVLVFTILTLSAFFSIKNNIKRQFNSCTSEGLVEFSVEKNENTFTVKNFQSGNVFNFNTQNIVKISTTKSLIVVKLKNKMIFDFPKRQDIADLFEVEI